MQLDAIIETSTINAFYVVLQDFEVVGVFFACFGEYFYSYFSAVCAY